MEIDFCLRNLRSGLEIAVPEIHNSDQGSHFTNSQYADILEEKGINISNDGMGDLMVKFKRDEVQNILLIGENQLTISGNLRDGTRLEGGDVVRGLRGNRKLL